MPGKRGLNGNLGGFNSKTPAEDTFYGLYSLQHRGQEAGNDAMTIVAKHFIVSIEELREGTPTFGLSAIPLA